MQYLPSQFRINNKLKKEMKRTITLEIIEMITKNIFEQPYYFRKFT